MDVIVQAVRVAAKAAVVPGFRARGQDVRSQTRGCAGLVSGAVTGGGAVVGSGGAGRW